MKPACIVVLGCLLALLPILGQQPAAKRTGQISGRIYRADTGAPLANVKVTAQNSESRTHVLTQTDAAGKYTFKDLPAGSYHVAGYREGFIGGFYTLPRTRNHDFPPVDVPATANISGIDIRLDPAPRISTISAAAIRAAYPGKSVQVEMGRFSPDGSKVALVISNVRTGDAEQVWMYDRPSRRMVPATESPLSGSDPHITSLTWGTDGILYVQGEHRSPGGGSYNVAATMAKIEEIAEFAPKAGADFLDDRVLSLSTEDTGFDNGRFRIWLERTRGGDFHLMGSSNSASPFEVDIGRWNLSTVIFDGARVIYIKPERMSVSVTAVDLTTRRARKLFSVPQIDPHILDVSRDGKQFLYTVRGACDPGSVTTNGALLFNRPNSNESRPQVVCVAEIR